MSDGNSSAYREQREAEERERMRLARLRVIAAALAVQRSDEADAFAIAVDQVRHEAVHEARLRRASDADAVAATPVQHLAVAALGFWKGEDPAAVINSLLAKDRAAWAHLLAAAYGTEWWPRLLAASPFVGKVPLLLAYDACSYWHDDQGKLRFSWQRDGHEAASTAYLRALAEKDGNAFEFQVGDGWDMAYCKYLFLALPPV